MQKMVVVTPNSWNRCFHFTSLNIDARLHIVLSHVLRQRRQRSLWVCDCNCNSGVSQEVILLSSFPRLQGHECARNAARLYTFVTSETFAQVFLSGHCHGLLCLWLTGSRLSFSAGDVIMAVGLAADGIVVNVCLQWHTHTLSERQGAKGEDLTIETHCLPEQRARARERKNKRMFWMTGENNRIPVMHRCRCVYGVHFCYLCFFFFPSSSQTSCRLTLDLMLFFMHRSGPKQENLFCTETHCLNIRETGNLLAEQSHSSKRKMFWVLFYLRHKVWIYWFSSRSCLWLAFTDKTVFALVTMK